MLKSIVEIFPTFKIYQQKPANKIPDKVIRLKNTKNILWYKKDVDM